MDFLFVFKHFLNDFLHEYFCFTWHETHLLKLKFESCVLFVFYFFVFFFIRSCINQPKYLYHIISD